jgi:hypothetical protein
MLTRRSFLLSSTVAVMACNFAPAPLDPARVELIDPTAEPFRGQFNRDAQFSRLVILVSST